MHALYVMKSSKNVVEDDCEITRPWRLEVRNCKTTNSCSVLIDFVEKET